MNKIIVIVGLPGSGKTFLGNQLSDNDNILLDDFEYSKEYFFDISKNYILTNPYFCTTSKENIISKLPTVFEISFIFFENNLENCWYNVQNRQEYKKICYSFMKHLSDNYLKNYNLDDENIISVKKY